MKTNKIFASILTLSMVIFGAASGVSKTFDNATGDNLKKSNTTITSGRNSEISASIGSADPATDFSYLRFDVNNFTESTTDNMIELPVNEFDYLRFDVNNFSESTTDNMIELPVNEFDYLRFDVNNFTGSNTDNTIELPVNEFDYLRFDVKLFTNVSGSTIDELPVTE